MTIDLPKDLEERVRAKVEAGEYPSPDAVLRAGLEALDMLDRGPVDEPWLTHVRQVFEDGRAAIARGEGIQQSPAEVVARIRERVDRRGKLT